MTDVQSNRRVRRAQRAIETREGGDLVARSVVVSLQGVLHLE